MPNIWARLSFAIDIIESNAVHFVAGMFQFLAEHAIAMFLSSANAQLIPKFQHIMCTRHSFFIKISLCLRMVVDLFASTIYR